MVTKHPICWQHLICWHVLGVLKKQHMWRRTVVPYIFIWKSTITRRMRGLSTISGYFRFYQLFRWENRKCECLRPISYFCPNFIYLSKCTRQDASNELSCIKPSFRYQRQVQISSIIYRKIGIKSQTLYLNPLVPTAPLVARLPL